jgi:hypothetical protein
MTQTIVSHQSNNSAANNETNDANDNCKIRNKYANDGDATTLGGGTVLSSGHRPDLRRNSAALGFAQFWLEPKMLVTDTFALVMLLLARLGLLPDSVSTYK